MSEDKKSPAERMREFRARQKEQGRTKTEFYLTEAEAAFLKEKLEAYRESTSKSRKKIIAIKTPIGKGRCLAL